MLPGMQKLKSLPWLQGGVQSQGLGSGAGNGVDAGLLPDRNQPPKKTKPPKTISKQMTGCISQCSSKMTEILSWQAKLAEMIGPYRQRSSRLVSFLDPEHVDVNFVPNDA